jgi:hypothetical protein
MNVTTHLTNPERLMRSLLDQAEILAQEAAAQATIDVVLSINQSRVSPTTFSAPQTPEIDRQPWRSNP